MTQPEEYAAEPLAEQQIADIQVRLAALQESIARAHVADWTTTLLVQTVANAKAVRSECDRFIRVVEHISTMTLVRYAVQPDPEQSGPPRVVDLDSFRAPTDLRGLEP